MHWLFIRNGFVSTIFVPHSSNYSVFQIGAYTFNQYLCQFLDLVKSPKDVQNKEVVVGLVTDMDLLHYVTQNETSKLTSISENNSTNSGNATPENLD